MEDKYIVFECSGGVGKNIAATAVVKALKEKHNERKIIVTTAYPDIWMNNPNVFKTYMLGSLQWFYSDYIVNKDTLICANEPYKTTSHILKEKHLIESWGELCGVEAKKSDIELHFSIGDNSAQPVVSFENEKPILVFQPFGGVNFEGNGPSFSWSRDIHPIIAQQLVDLAKDAYNIVHICYPYHPELEDVTRFDTEINKKGLFSILPQADKRLLIDSSLQHAAAAMKLPSTVVWGVTDPKLFGYSIHDNITPPKKFEDGHIGSYLHDYSFEGAPQECPYTNLDDMYDVSKIIESLNK